MRKTKSWLKSLLIVVMAMLLVFSLVACNKPSSDDNKPDDTNKPNDTTPTVIQESSSDYFNGLWTVAKPIGAKSIKENADLALNLGMEIALNVYSDADTSGAVYHQIDLGLDIQAVIGRSKATSKNTALKLRLYDPTDADNDEIITLYAFAQDIDNLYIDYSGKNVKVPHNMAKLIWGEVLGHLTEGDDLGSNIIEGLTNKFITIGGEKKSINDIINEFVGDFGANWSLNSIVDRLLSMFDFNLVEFINNSSLKNAILSILGVSDANELLDNGKLNLLSILSGQVGNFVFAPSKWVEGDVTVHKAKLQNMVLQALGLAGLNYISDMVGGTGEIALQYTESNGAINDFSIIAKLGGMSGKLANGANGIPELVVKINKLSIEELTTENGVKTKVAENLYTEDIAFNEQIVLETHGITIGAIEGLTEDVISLNGEVIVDIKGRLDIVNKTNNKTQANITVSLKNREEEPQTIAQLSYANGKIVGELASAITVKGENGQDMTVKGFVYDLGESFDFATFVQENVKELIYTWFPSTRPQPPVEEEGGDAEPTAENATFDIKGFCEKLSKVVSVAVRYISTDNNIEISTSNILQTVIDFKEAVNEGTKPRPSNPKPENPVWTQENRIEAITNALINPPNADKNISECFAIIMEQAKLIMEEMKKQDSDNNIEVAPGGDQNQEGALNEGETPGEPENPDEGNEGNVTPAFDWKGTLNTIKDATLRILYICAQEVRIEGVETENLKDSDYAKIEKADGTELTDVEKIYINNIIAVLGAQITIKADLQSGMHASISIKIADATMSASHSFELIDVKADTFTDLYNHYKDDENKAQWIDLNQMIKDREEGSQPTE